MLTRTLVNLPSKTMVEVHPPKSFLLLHGLKILVFKKELPAPISLALVEPMQALQPVVSARNGLSQHLFTLKFPLGSIKSTQLLEALMLSPYQKLGSVREVLPETLS